MLLNRGELEGTRILSPKTVDMMTVNQLPAQAMPLSTNIPANGWIVNGWGFGMGFRVLMDPVAAGSAASLGSYGWFGIRNTFFLIDPKEQLIGIFMAQFTPPPLYPGVREFQSLMFQAIVR
jgi:CubicO group peptidase (beta-lactamase class C family)